MKSKTSFFNRGILKQDLRQHGWLSLIYFVGLLFVLPIKLMMLASDETTNQLEYIEHLFSHHFDVQIFLMAVIPVFTGIFIFRYIQVKESADMIHSLPVTRGGLFFNHMINGLLLLLVPVWLTAVVTSIVISTLPAISVLTMTHAWQWALIVTLFTCFFYAFSIFTGMITGVSIVQGILTFIFLILPTGLMVLLSSHLSLYLYGFSERYYTSSGFSTWSPIFRLPEIGRVEMSAGEVITYVGLTIVFFAFAYGLYRWRHIETAAQTISFHLLRPVFKYGVAFCSMLLAGLYFMQNDHVGWRIFGYVVGSFIGYVVAEMILQKTWRIFRLRTLTGYAGYAVVIILLFMGVQTDVLGYETRIPEMDRIEGVHFGYTVYDIRHRQDAGQQVFHSDEEYIEKVRAFHQEVTEKQPDGEAMMTKRYAIAYQLDNGNLFVREFDVVDEEVKGTLVDVLESETYKRDIYNISQLEQPLKSMSIHPKEPVDKQIIITDSDEIEEAKELLKQEILAMSFEEVRNDHKQWARIEVTPSRTATEQEQLEKHPVTHIPLGWHVSFERFETWLQEKGYWEQARVMPEDIDSLEIAKMQDGHRGPPHSIFTDRSEYDIVSINDTVDMEEQQVEKLLTEYVQYRGHHGDLQSGSYALKFVTTGGAEFYGVIAADSLPAEWME